MHLTEANYFQGIPTAPLWDFCKGEFVGVLSALDFVLIIREVCVMVFLGSLVQICKLQVWLSDHNFKVWKLPNLEVYDTAESFAVIYLFAVK